jgi:hypothetical protein
MIYFDQRTKKPLYDTKKGSYAYDADVARVKDSYGQPICFDADGNVVYDTENGKPMVVLNESGYPIQYDHTDEDVAKQKQKAESLMATLTEGNFADFEAAIKENALVLGAAEEFPDGYYLGEIERAQYKGDVAYLADILDMLEGMEVGEIAIYESDAGYHVIMKYDLKTGQYTVKGYEGWFAALDGHIIGDLFDIRIADTLAKIKINEANLANARSIADVGINYDY